MGNDLSVTNKAGMPVEKNDHWAISSIYDALMVTSKIYPESDAYWYEGRTQKYNNLLVKVNTFAEYLSKEGITKGDYVAIILPNIPQAIVAMYAVNAIGAISVILHPEWDSDKIRRYLEIVPCKVGITLDLLAGKIAKNEFVKKWILTSAVDELTVMDRIIYRLKNRSSQEPTLTASVAWKSVFHTGEKNKKYLCKPSSGDLKIGDETAVVLFSGGTTGAAKGVCLSNNNLNVFARQIKELNPMIEDGKDSILAALPIFHGFGLGVGIHSGIYHGVCCVLSIKPYAKPVAEVLHRKKCEFLVGIPSMYEAMTRAPLLKDEDFSHLKGVFCGGDHLTPELRMKINSFLTSHKSKVQLREGYGMTETVAMVTLEPENGNNSSQPRPSVGIPASGTEIRISDEPYADQKSAGEIGEILISGPTVMNGYIRHPEANRIAFTEDNGKRWIRTGDLGYLSADGKLHYAGRKKRILVVNGFNVFPQNVEDVINRSELVSECCVVGGKDEKTGTNYGKAFIRLADGISSDDSTKRKIYEFCRENMSKYEIPKEIEFVDNIPKTGIGKVNHKYFENLQEEKANG